jgi:hypothetical protein
MRLGWQQRLLRFMETFPITKSTSVDAEAIQPVLTNFAKGRNANDAAKFSPVCEEDADFKNVMGISREGFL